jgi:hypothetical protein
LRRVQDFENDKNSAPSSPGCLCSWVEKDQEGKEGCQEVTAITPVSMLSSPRGSFPSLAFKSFLKFIFLSCVSDQSHLSAYTVTIFTTVFRRWSPGLCLRDPNACLKITLPNLWGLEKKK